MSFSIKTKKFFLFIIRIMANKVHHLLINSINRQNVENANDFHMQFSNAPSNQDATSVSSSLVHGIHWFYNIYEATSVGIVFDDFTSPGDLYANILTVPLGQYTASSLATTLSSLLSAINAGTTVTVNATTGKFEITPGVSGDFYWPSRDVLESPQLVTLAPIANLAAFSSVSKTWSLNTLIGCATHVFNQGDQTVILTHTPTSVLTSLPLMFNLAGPQLVLVKSTSLAGSNAIDSVSGNVTTFLDVIDLSSTAYGAMFTHQTHELGSKRISFHGRRALTNIDIKFTDIYHQRLTVPENHVFSMHVRSGTNYH